MYLEAVVICVNYSDFLAETLPTNRHQFDYLVVVTTPEDKKTQELCQYYNVHCVQTTAFGTAGFSKGAGINEGLKHLKRTGWVCHLDADILLPPRAREYLEKLQPDESYIYGCDRFQIPNACYWKSDRRAPKLTHCDWGCAYDCGTFIFANCHPVGVRIGAPSGFVPIGFFQLWHPKGSGKYEYIQGKSTAGGEDMIFALQWPRAKRGFIPDFSVYHLESEPVKMGTNWTGRKTRIFDLSEPCYKPSFWSKCKDFWKSL